MNRNSMINDEYKNNKSIRNSIMQYKKLSEYNPWLGCCKGVNGNNPACNNIIDEYNCLAVADKACEWQRGDPHLGCGDGGCCLNSYSGFLCSIETDNGEEDHSIWGCDNSDKRHDENIACRWYFGPKAESKFQSKCYYNPLPNTCLPIDHTNSDNNIEYCSQFNESSCNEPCYWGPSPADIVYPGQPDYVLGCCRGVEGRRPDMDDYCRKLSEETDDSTTDFGPEAKCRSQTVCKWYEPETTNSEWECPSAPTPTPTPTPTCTLSLTHP